MYIKGGEKMTGWNWSPNGDDPVYLITTSRICEDH